MVNTVKDSERLLRDVNSISAWCFLNDLVLNETKTKIMSFSGKRDTGSFSYTLGDNAIARVSVIRDLGVYMDPVFNFNHLVIAVTNVYFKVLGVITRVTRNSVVRT